MANTLIIGRLLWLRSAVCRALGKEHRRVYTGLAAMLVESSLLYTIVLGIGYWALPGMSGSTAMFSPLVTQTKVCACTPDHYPEIFVLTSANRDISLASYRI